MRLRKSTFQTIIIIRIMIPVFFAVILIDSCTKSKDSVEPVNRSGNFELVSDSIHNQTQVISIYSYHGKAGDYWNFTSDSLYTKEGQQLDTVGLRLNHDSLLIGGIPFRVSSESGGNIRLQNIKPEIDFGGNYDRIIVLRPTSSNITFLYTGRIIFEIK